MRKPILLIFALTITILSAKAQETNATSDSLREDAVKVFIDCMMCDMNYIRQEIPYINYVRDTKEAQLYIRESMQTTGSGGREYTYFFEGQEKFDGLTDTLVYASSPDDVIEKTRQGRTDMMKMGLMRYVARTPIHKEITINHLGFANKGENEQVIDKWNNWVFEIETQPQYEWEDTRKEISFRNNFSATKVTPDWKIESRFSHRYSETEYDFEDFGYTAVTRSVSLNNIIVKSISQHWSAGAMVNYLNSNRQNYEYQLEVFPSIEYNLFPYAESNHRQLRLLYSIGGEFSQYMDTTIFGQTKENLAKQELQVAYEVSERWGSVNVSLQGSNYLKDFSKHRIQMSGFLMIRIIKGLSFNLRGSVAKINDQINLSGEGATDQESLLDLKEQATSYRINGGVGFTYTFGSIFNNVVNPRFGNGRSGGGGGFTGGGGGFR